MDPRTPHYLRFVRTLALATTLALPACGDATTRTPSDDPADQTSTTTASSGTGSATTAPTGTATMTATATDTSTTSVSAPEDAGPAATPRPGSAPARCRRSTCRFDGLTPMLAPLTAALTGTRIEAEYRAVASSLARVRPTAHAFDVGAYEPRAVARARGLWSIAWSTSTPPRPCSRRWRRSSFEANATIDATAVALRMGHDELVHAEACAGVVVAMGGVARRMRHTDVVAIARTPAARPRSGRCAT